MVGLGETPEEVRGALADLRAVGVDIVTIGQYLRPTARHRPIDRYVAPEEFAAYRAHGAALGLPRVEAGPLVRSSYHAGEAREAAGVGRRDSRTAAPAADVAAQASEGHRR